MRAESDKIIGPPPTQQTPQPRHCRPEWMMPKIVLPLYCSSLGNSWLTSPLIYPPTPKGVAPCPSTSAVLIRSVFFLWLSLVCFFCRAAAAAAGDGKAQGRSDQGRLHLGKRERTGQADTMWWAGPFSPIFWCMFTRSTDSLVISKLWQLVGDRRVHLLRSTTYH